MNSHANIVEKEDTCIIYPRKASIIETIIAHTIYPNALLAVLIWLLNQNVKMGWILIVCVAIVYAYSIFKIVKGIRVLNNPLSPIILTHKDITLSNGCKVLWKDVDKLNRKYIRGNTPNLALRNSKGVLLAVIDDWILYATQKELVNLFEKYANKKMYDPRII